MRTLVHRPGAIRRKPNSNMDAGVLEVKMKKKLMERNALAIGSELKSLVPIVKKNTTNITRKDTFREERAIAITRLRLPPATKNIVNKQVNLTKSEARRTKERAPPVAGAFKKRTIPKSQFPSSYNRGQLPILIDHKMGGNSLKWTIDVDKLDYTSLLPLFFEGIREQEEPFRFVAHQGVITLLDHGIEHPRKVHSCLHKIIQPIRTALNTRETKLIKETLKFIQHLLKVDGIGVAMLPYYRQILPVLNIFKTQRQNVGDQMDYGQRNHSDMGEIIQETLEMFETTGGPDAYVNLKYMIPTYEGTHIV